MAERHPVFQPDDQGRRLEAGGDAFDPPLLPYEKSLIAALGCSEEEYKEFLRHAHLRARTRPAEYDIVPEINNSGLSPFEIILINLAIGLLVQAASYFLFSPEKPKQIKRRDLADQIGPSRFNQTTSFDNVAALAEYGQVIPIPFGKRDIGADDAPTGGLTLVPSLVWSRCHSYGAFQAFDAIYVAGQAGLAKPEISGIWIGTTPITALSDTEYALFWSSLRGNNRPSTSVSPTANLIGGSAGPGATGTLGREGAGANSRALFIAPTVEGGRFDTKGFSMAYNPSGQSQFGTSNVIDNGTAFRYNWEVISVPAAIEDDDQLEDMKARRRKIAGSKASLLSFKRNKDNPQAGQPGVGRAYSRAMGIVAVNGTYYANRTIVSVGVGDTATFEISGQDWEQFAKADFALKPGVPGETNLQDLRDSAISWRQNADSRLAVGTKWIIGATLWVVKSRSGGIWEPGKTSNITLQCVEVQGLGRIGVAGTRTVRGELAGYEGDTFDSSLHVGPGYFPICQYSAATVRPVRRDCQIIEIGIRSNVWNQASGLCNFSEIPTPAKLYMLDRKNVSLSGGVMNKYFERTSCFSIYVRPVQGPGVTSPVRWRRIPEVFCVTGSAPVDQYNFLRIQPLATGHYEYQLVPRSGADIAQNSDDNEEVFELSTQTGSAYTNDYQSPYGAFRITSVGRVLTIGAIKRNPEMSTQAGEAVIQPPPVSLDTPKSVVYSGASSNTGATPWLLQSWLSGQSMFNVRPWAPQNRGQSFAKQITLSTGVTGKTVTIEVRATSLATGGDYYKRYVTADDGQGWRWDNITYVVGSSTGKWALNDTATFTTSVIASGTPLSNIPGQSYTRVTAVFSCDALNFTVPPPTNVKVAAREFETQSRIADTSHYLELTKSNANKPEHEIVYVNEFTSNETEASYLDLSTVGLCINSSGQVNAVGQLRLWMKDGIAVTRLNDGNSEGPSNLFTDLVYYLLTNQAQGVGRSVPEALVDVDSLRLTGQYLRANKLFYDGVVEDVTALRSFLYERASLLMCNFTIKNGRFGMMPALPVDSTGVISTAPIRIEQIFSSGNIIEDSFQLQYLDGAQRTDFRAVVSWRVMEDNDLPTQATALVDWADWPEGQRRATQQSFDLTDFCTNREQALKLARFLLSSRRYTTHSISFKTIPDALAIQPGSYIRVVTEAATYNVASNGAITDAGVLYSITTVRDGTYNALVYRPSTAAVSARSITVSNGRVTDSSLFGTLFTLLDSAVSKGVYQVERLSLDDNGLVDISAIFVPTDEQGASLIARDVLDASRFRVLE